jgi:hypothetical protein
MVTGQSVASGVTKFLQNLNGVILNRLTTIYLWLTRIWVGLHIPLLLDKKL